MRTLNIATRRELLTRGLGLIGIGAAIPDFLIRSALAGPSALPGQRVLVILQLDGGNDSLNTVIPYGHKEYYEYRKAAKKKRQLRAGEGAMMASNKQRPTECADWHGADAQHEP